MTNKFRIILDPATVSEIIESETGNLPTEEEILKVMEWLDKNAGYVYEGLWMVIESAIEKAYYEVRSKDDDR